VAYRQTPKLSTLKAIQKALEADGIEFTENESRCIGFHLKSTKRAGTKTTLLIIDDSAPDRMLYKSG